MKIHANCNALTKQNFEHQNQLAAAGAGGVEGKSPQFKTTNFELEK